jgi:hypothetical protein
MILVRPNMMKICVGPAGGAAGSWRMGADYPELGHLFGRPVFCKKQTIGGSNVTVYGSTGYSKATG